MQYFHHRVFTESLTEEASYTRTSIISLVVIGLRRVGFFHWLWQFVWMVLPALPLISFVNNSQTQTEPSSLPLFIVQYGMMASIISSSMLVPLIFYQLNRNGGQILNNKQLKIPMLMPILIPSIMIKVAYHIFTVVNTPSIEGIVLVFIVFDILYYIVLTVLFGSMFGTFEKQVKRGHMERTLDNFYKILEQYRYLVHQTNVISVFFFLIRNTLYFKSIERRIWIWIIPCIFELHNHVYFEYIYVATWYPRMLVFIRK